MNIVIEEIYNLIEAIIVTWFITSYFKTKSKFHHKMVKFLSFALIAVQINIVSILGLHWIFTMIISSISLLGISTLLLKGTHSERLVISSTAILLLALSDICAFTLIGKLLGVDYKLLVVDNTFSRFLAVSTSKVLYLIIASVILFFKKKYSIFIHKRETVLIVITLLISGLQISLIRNIIYEQRQYYNIFLVVLLCVLSLN